MTTLEAVPAKLAEIQTLRALFLQEANCQIRWKCVPTGDVKVTAAFSSRN